MTAAGTPRAALVSCWAVAAAHACPAPAAPFVSGSWQKGPHVLYGHGTSGVQQEVPTVCVQSFSLAVVLFPSALAEPSGLKVSWILQRRTLSLLHHHHVACPASFHTLPFLRRIPTLLDLTQRAFTTRCAKRKLTCHEPIQSLRWLWPPLTNLILAHSSSNRNTTITKMRNPPTLQTRSINTISSTLTAPTTISSLSIKRRP